MIDKLTAHLLAGHEFKLVDKEGETTFTITGIMDDTFYLVDEESTPHYFRFDEAGVEFFVLCRPFASLTKTIKYDGDDIVPVELFEIGDESGYEFEFEHGNIKTIGVLKSVAEHNSGYDLYYLPSPVTETLLHLHFKPSSLPDECCRFIEG